MFDSFGIVHVCLLQFNHCVKAHLGDKEIEAWTRASARE